MTQAPDYMAILSARRSELQARLTEIDRELDSHQSKDWEELATEREADEVLEGLGNSGLHEIAMIDAALKRITDGEFGFCATCGTEISAERLAVLPYTPFCRHCAV